MHFKICNECNKKLKAEEFYSDKRNNDRLTGKCKKCYRKNNKIWMKNNKKFRKEYAKNYRINYHKNYPWIRSLRSAQTRCNNPKNKRFENYGGRGITFNLTDKEGQFLWFRDKAWKLKKPSLDRINNDGNYCLENCRFIEFSKNATKDKLVSILQYNLDGNFIREWSNITDAEKEITGCKRSKGKISAVAKGKRKTAFGYIWKYKE